MYPVNPNVLIQMIRQGKNPQQLLLSILQGEAYKSREMNKDRSVQLRELERYTQDLSQDVMEMISEASPEEKQYLEKKVTAMAAKISQLK